jgi:hypothetical protein
MYRSLIFYLPQEGSQLPSVIKIQKNDRLVTERDILYKSTFF